MKTTYKIGRSSSRNDIVLNDMTVSSEHAVLSVYNQSGQVVFMLSDCNSTNGTFVNGQKVSSSASIKYGDRILFGSYSMTYSELTSYVKFDDCESTRMVDTESTRVHSPSPRPITYPGYHQQEAPQSTPQWSASSQARPSCPETHMAKAIIITLLCCWPLGIPAIVNASRVTSSYTNGEYDAARTYSDRANNWCNYSMIAAAVVFVIVFIISFLAEYYSY